MHSIKNRKIGSFLTSLLFFLSFYTSQAQTAVDTCGQLSVDGIHIVDQNGNPVQLQGMSLFWSQWTPSHFYSRNTLEWLRDDWCNNIVRAAMAVEDQGGYLTNPGEEQKVRTVVEAAIELGMYVIIDWHSHYAHQHTNAAVDFFSRMARDYGNYPNIIYEIYNEPLGSSWDNVLKPYHETVIAAIREHDDNNIIVCGTRQWSQRLDEAAANPITGYDNIAYTLHYYAGSHGDELRGWAQTAIDNNLCLFVTEYGLVNADGDGGVSVNSSNIWYDWMEQYKISHCNWSINNKAEGASALTPNTGPAPWTQSQLTASGTFVRNYHRSKCPTYEATIPVITQQPQHVHTTIGDEAVFSVVAIGGGLNYQWLKNGIEIQGATSASYTIANVSENDFGDYRVVVYNDLGSIESNVGSLILLQPGPWNGTPHTIPGIIQAEEFDIGGNNIAFFDSDPTTNLGGAFRNDGVDIETTGDTGGGYNVGWIEEGEWLNYTVNVLHEGEYDFRFRVATNNMGGSSFRVENGNGDIIIPVIDVSNTSGWQTYTTISVNNVSLTIGEQVFRLYFEQSGLNINYFEVDGDFEDCNGVNGGTAYIDECGNCVGGNTGEVACERDCNQVWGGTAYVDECGECVGGTTELVACSQDCSGEWGGMAYIDECESCVGGLTNSDPCETDCNNVPGGEAYIDDCDICVGGTTGVSPNSQCPPTILSDLPSNLVLDLGAALSLSIETDDDGSYTYQWFYNDQIIEGATSSTFEITNVSMLQAGQYSVVVTNEYGSTDSAVLDVTVETVPGPWNGVPHTIPGIIPAEEFDLGGQDVAYFDLYPESNEGGAFRDEGVDIEENNNEPSVYHIGWTNSGEWVNYTVEVLVDGAYDFTFRVASEHDDRTFNIEWNGEIIIPEVVVPNTTNWHIYQTVTINNVPLSAGQHIMRVNFLDEGLNLESIEINGDFEADCNGTLLGDAYLDECGVCVGGTTDLLPCEQDCNGDWGGEAYIDSCGICAGGETTVVPVDDPDQCILLYKDELSVREWMVYPNPTTDIVHIKLPMLKGTIMLYDVSGRMIEMIDVASGEMTIETQNLPKGIYQLVWIHDNGRSIMKISIL